MAGEGNLGTNRCLLAVNGGTNLHAAYGTHTTVAASDTLDTGLSRVLFAVATLESDPVLAVDRAHAVIGDQAGTPAAGKILIKTFKPTDATDPTPIAATTYSKKVNWIAIGLQ